MERSFPKQVSTPYSQRAKTNTARSYKTRTDCTKSPPLPTDKTKPDWAGEHLLSKLVNSAISNAVLYEGIMKPMARRTMITTAEKNGVMWRTNVATLEETRDVYTIYNEIKDTSMEYPEYYLQPFHAYTEGNLCWQAAFEAESATYAMALRAWPKEALQWEEAQDRLRDSYVRNIKEHIQEHNLASPLRIVDAGCSVGISTRSIHESFPEAEMIGLDLSTHMLAVAAYRDANETSMIQRVPAENKSLKQRRNWVHKKAEDTGFETSSMDLFSLSFVLHELPQQATRDVIAEAARVLRPGGVFVMCDNNPLSAVIQNLPPVIFTLMKSTEPHSDEYFSFNMEQALRDAGFTQVHTEIMDPRHRIVLATR
eukprot:CAMPEP_0198202324 /NCGR_PEP_ID=MMETSP1445-20131203/5459_1 /TAXON_ID=36898 /ORGANISM="Pyramimonas sp., Strain CCMP2087" /LENGTH=367 /DNA_ID=CAMNT_0043873181 /DNA_START=181 /DNA_END=1284 /DNA_ORIENTATION=-